MGAKVHHDLDLRTLDREYDNRGKVSPDALQAYRAVWATESERARAALKATLDISYGASALEKLDVFQPERIGPCPVQIYVHGGYWHLGDKRDCSYVALGLCGANMVTVVVNYGLALDVSVGRQVEQVRAAILWVRDNVAQYGGDPTRISLVGHSAGGHLAVMAVSHDEAGIPHLPSGLVKGICALSGVYELAPVRLTSLNQYIGLTEQDVSLLSPANLDFEDGVPLLAGVGSLEGAEFIRQNRAIVRHWSKSSAPVMEKIYEGDDHFSIRTQLRDRDSELCRDIVKLAGQNTF